MTAADVGFDTEQTITNTDVAIAHVESANHDRLARTGPAINVYDGSDAPVLALSGQPRFNIARKLL